MRVTPKSLAVLSTLVERPGEVVTKDELFRAVWPDATVSDAALTSCIVELRRVLEDDARQPRYVETVHRRGFRFIAHASAERTSHGARGVDSAGSDADRDAIVGREPAIRQMSSALDLAADGRRQLVVVTGEPGIGKTALVNAFVSRLAAGETWRIGRGDCVEHYGAGEAYQPLLEALTRLCLEQEGDEVVATLRACAPTWLAQLPAVQTPAELAALRRRTAGVTPERMLRELTDAIETMAMRTPIVLCLEDLHWSDSSTLDWIASFARRPEPVRVLLLATYRPGEATASRSPESMAHGLRVKALCAQIALAGLNREEVAEYVRRRFPPAPSAQAQLERLACLVSQHTEGNPLFVVNVLTDLVARGILVGRDDRWTVSEELDAPALGVPTDIRHTIERQIDRLDDTERQLLEVAAILGGGCCAAAVAAGAGCPVSEVEETLAALVRRHALVRAGAAVEWPDGTVSAGFELLHALYAEVLAVRLPPGRRAEIHRSIATRLEAAYGDRSPEIAAELAVHFEQARDLPRAIHYLQHAGEIDRRRSALDGALQHFRRALVLLDRLPESDERDEREVALRIGLGTVLMQINGWGSLEVEEAYARARALCETRAAAPHAFSSLWNLWIFYVSRGRLDTAQQLVNRLSALAHASGDDAMLLQAHHARWTTLFALGDLRGAESHAREGIRLSEPHPIETMLSYGSHHAGICARTFCARALALSGRTDAAVRMCDEMVALARGLDHPFSLGMTLVHAAAVHEARRDPQAAREHASAARELAARESFGLLLAWAECFLGWSMAALGEVGDGLSMLGAGVARARETGSEMFLPHVIGLLASVQLRNGLVDDAQASLNEALAVSNRTGQAFHLAELYRLRGELSLAVGNDDARPRAEEDFHTALSVAERQGAQQLSLRAAVSLARLWSRDGLAADAEHLVRQARGRISEGSGLPDVAEATSLLSGLQKSIGG